MDVVGDIDTAHNLVITKSRYSPLADRVIDKPGVELGRELAAWLGSGVKDARMVKARAACADLTAALASSGHGEAARKAGEPFPLWESDIEQAKGLYRALSAIEKGGQPAT